MDNSPSCKLKATYVTFCVITISRLVDQMRKKLYKLQCLYRNKAYLQLIRGFSPSETWYRKNSLVGLSGFLFTCNTHSKSRKM